MAPPTPGNKLLPSIGRSLLLTVLIMLGVYLLTDGKFLFIPMLFLPAMPFFRRSHRQAPHRPAPAVRDLAIPAPPRADAEERRLEQVPLPPAGSIEPPKADPRWN